MKGLALALSFVLPAAAPAAPLELPWKLVELDNGLQLLMQPDASMAEVGVELWTRGGSREEAPGQFGIAHLFEHNLPASGRFLGNPANRTARDRGLRANGAGTHPDFLRFYTIVAPDALEPALGHLADRLESDPAKFTEESVRRDHDIVASELRRNSTVDWNVDVQARLYPGTFGIEHPYGHSVQGLERDVRAATAETMRDWHRRFTGAAQAIVLVVGNFDPAQAEAMVRRHFSSIPPGVVLPRLARWVPPARDIRDVMEMEVARGVVYLRWPIPGWGTADGDRLSLVADVLSRRLPAGSTASAELHELAGSFTLRGEIAEGATAASVEQSLRAELTRFLKDGVPEAELAGVKAQQNTALLRMLQRPVWRGSRGDLLAQGLMFAGNPDAWRESAARVAAAGPEDVRETARGWLSPPGYVLHVIPRPARSATGTIDRSAPVAVPGPMPARFPEVTRFEVAGLPVLLAERSQAPLAAVTFAFGPGASDEDLRALLTRVEPALAPLGAQLATGRDADFATLSMVLPRGEARTALGVVAAALPAIPRQAVRATPRGATSREAILEQLLDSDAKEANAASGLQLVSAAGGIDRATLEAALSNVNAAPAAGARRSDALPRGRTIVVHDPAATQSRILLAQPMSARAARDPLMAQVLAYALRARLMANLRSDKGWSYEIYPFGARVTRGTAALRFNLPVHTDKTGESIAEILAEIRRLREEPVTEPFLAGIRGHVEGSELATGLGTVEQLNAQLLDLARADLPPSYYAEALRRLPTIAATDVTRAARELLDADQLIWILSGDRAVLERELAEIGVTDVEVR